jgi:serine/threonine-protein kinase
MSPEVGSVIGGKYCLFNALARGGRGSIWVARHTELDVSVAVKLISPELLASDTAVTRFRHEARAAAQLRSAMA